MELLPFLAKFAEHFLFLVKNSYQFLLEFQLSIRFLMTLGLVTLLPLCLSRLFFPSPVRERESRYGPLIDSAYILCVCTLFYTQAYLFPLVTAHLYSIDTSSISLETSREIHLLLLSFSCRFALT